MSNLREIAVVLTPAQAEFLKKNCDSNLEYGLQAMMKMHAEPDTPQSFFENMVALMENFRAIRKAVEDAGG